jgi:hypothetical protein
MLLSFLAVLRFEFGASCLLRQALYCLSSLLTSFLAYWLIPAVLTFLPVSHLARCSEYPRPLWAWTCVLLSDWGFKPFHVSSILTLGLGPKPQPSPQVATERKERFLGSGGLIFWGSSFLYHLFLPLPPFPQLLRHLHAHYQHLGVLYASSFPVKLHLNKYKLLYTCNEICQSPTLLFLAVSFQQFPIQGDWWGMMDKSLKYDCVPTG